MTVSVLLSLLFGIDHDTAHKLLLAKTYAQVGMLADAEDNVAAAKEAFSIAGRFASRLTCSCC